MNKLIIVILIIIQFKIIKNENLSSFEIMSAPDVLIVGESGRIELKLTSPLNQSASITFLNDQENLLEWSPKSILIPQNSPASNFTIKIEALKAGRAEVTGISNPKHLISDSNLSFKITIGNSRELISTSFVVGWAYFLAWSICSYPQIWLNYKRKSVVGLSFDFLALNIIGHVSYTIFNLCFYFSEFFQDEYFTRFPNGQTPVLLNDVFSTSHSLLVCLVMIFQCFVYQNGKQSISYITWTLLGAFMTIVGVNVFFCSVGALHWLDILYTLSYIKLAVTLTKYIPQAVLNCRRKSTVGWSIERVLLDLIGGVLSILQMLINAYNYDDWISTFGNPAKLCLGLFSIFFDVIFITQHYCLYSSSRKSENKDSEQTDRSVK